MWRNFLRTDECEIFIAGQKQNHISLCPHLDRFLLLCTVRSLLIKLPFFSCSWVQFPRTVLQPSTRIIFTKQLSLFDQGDPNGTDESFDQALQRPPQQSMGPKSSPVWPIPPLSLLRTGGAVRGHYTQCFLLGQPWYLGNPPAPSLLS